MTLAAPDGEDSGAGPPFGGGLERDLLARRRAMRAAGDADDSLARRTAAAEATVETLERHVASLQRRLRELEEENERVAETLDDERAVAAERDRELRRIRQREYAEQQLRAEAESRLVVSAAAPQAPAVDWLEARVRAGEGAARELAAQLQAVTARLQTLERPRPPAPQPPDPAFERRVAELEQRARAAEDELASERSARERGETLLREARDASDPALERRVAELELRAQRAEGDLAAQLQTVTERVQALERARPPQPPDPALERRVAELERRAQAAAGELASERSARERGEALLREVRDASAGATRLVAELRDLVSRLGAQLQRPVLSAPVPLPRQDPADGDDISAALQAAAERLRARAAEAADDPGVTAQAAPIRTPHKHSVSLIARIRMRRKQRAAP